MKCRELEKQLKHLLENNDIHKITYLYYSYGDLINFCIENKISLTRHQRKLIMFAFNGTIKS